MSGGSGDSKVSEKGETINFADVVGIDEAKKPEEILEFLRNPDSYIWLVGHPPRGILLVRKKIKHSGLLAKAVAGEQKFHS